MKIGGYIFSVMLITLFLFNSTRVTLTYAYYKLDPIGFIEALCENKDRPELNCNGKCYLKKVVKAQDDEQKTPESITDFKELTLYLSCFEIIEFNPKEHLKKQNSTAYQNLYSLDNTCDCFHPPKSNLSVIIGSHIYHNYFS